MSKQVFYVTAHETRTVTIKVEASSMEDACELVVTGNFADEQVVETDDQRLYPLEVVGVGRVTSTNVLISNKD